jgi:hypothetical protein
MPRKGKGHSKKGRLAGATRREVNEQRIAKIVDGKMDGTTYARVVKVLGGNHLRVAIDSRSGAKEVLVRIPGLFLKRGATPLAIDTIVSIFVGREFNPNVDLKGEMFDLVAILSQKQALFLEDEGKVPTWMTRTGEIGAGDGGGEGWHFGVDESETTLFAKVRKYNDSGIAVDEDGIPVATGGAGSGRTERHDDDDDDNDDCDIDGI